MYTRCKKAYGAFGLSILEKIFVKNIFPFKYFVENKFKIKHLHVWLELFMSVYV